jgi:hypothetical protein
VPLARGPSFNSNMVDLSLRLVFTSVVASNLWPRDVELDLGTARPTTPSAARLYLNINNHDGQTIEDGSHKRDLPLKYT